MARDPFSSFSVLWSFCINEEGSEKLPGLILSTAVSLVSGILASGLTAYLLTILPR